MKLQCGLLYVEKMLGYDVKITCCANFCKESYGIFVRGLFFFFRRVEFVVVIEHDWRVYRLCRRRWPTLIGSYVDSVD